MIFLCVAVILILGIVQNKSLIYLIEQLAYICPLLYWLISKINGLNQDIYRLEELERLINTSDNTTMESLYKIQKGIYEQRKSECMVPDILYKSSKKKNEEVMKHIITYK